MSANPQRKEPDRLDARWLSGGAFGLLLAGLIVARFPGVVLGFSSFVYRDFGLFAYPSAYFQRQCFQVGQLPFWNPYNCCGIPMLAQWNTMPLYPPALLYLLLPLNWGLNMFCLVHLLLGGLGMYRLARSHTNDSMAAVVAGIAFAFGGVTQNFLMWPSHVATFAWMPWVVLIVPEACRLGGKRIMLAALAGAMQMLAGGPETILFTWLFAGALLLLDARIPGQRLQAALRFGAICVLVAGLAAVQLLPFLDLALHSQREHHFTDLRSAMPGRGWANLLVPLAFGHSWEAGVFKQEGQSWTSSYYTGILPLALAVLALWKLRDRRVWLLGAACCIAYVLALGEATPLYRLLLGVLPVFKGMTFPVKFVVVFAFAFPLLAAFGLTSLRGAGHSGAQMRGLRVCGVALGMAIAGVLVWQLSAPLQGDDVRGAVINGVARAAFLAGGIGTIHYLVRGGTPRFRIIVGGAVALLIWLDLATHVPLQNPTTEPSVYAPGIIRNELAMDPQPALGGSRVMISPAADAAFDTTPVEDMRTGYLARRLGYFSNCNLLDAVPKTTGFFSLYPYEYYQVSLLLYLTTNTSFPRLEDFLSVSHVTAPGEYTAWKKRDTFLPLATAGQKPFFLDETNTVLQLTRPDFDSTKVVFLAPESRIKVGVTNASAAKARVSRASNAELDIEAQGAEPFLVVISQTYYHLWRAYVDGQPRPLLRANYAFQAVEVPPGSHKVSLTYEDHGFQIGAAISAATVLCIGIWLAWSRKGMKAKDAPRAST